MERLCPYVKRAAACAAFAVLLFLLPAGAGAQVDLLVPEEFGSIQAAINAAEAGDSVVVGTGTYAETLTLKNGVTVRGVETARTFLSGGGGGPVVNANGPVDAGIHNFTFLNASTAVQVTNNPSALRITNNVFEVGAGGAAVTIQNSALTEVVNNVFFQNGSAVTTEVGIRISNNIFSGNATAIAGAGAPASTIANNAFFGNVATGPTGTAPVSADPLFVDPVNHDFHLRELSPCIDTGDPAVSDIIDLTRSDIGAYGGPEADPFPFPVAGLTITFTTENSIDFTWSPNNSYLVSLGGYNVYYGYASGDYNGDDAEGGFSPSPIALGPETSFSLFDLSPQTSAVPPAPVLNPPAPGDGQLRLTWSASPGATGYNVHYGAISTGENTIDAGNTTSYTITGLTNGQSYRVAVSAYAQAAIYYIAVTAVDGTADAFESDFSQEVSVQLGPTPESGLSNVETDFPEPVVLFPALPDPGKVCFIATAAYGSYSAPEVEALRAFRDRYLLTSALGRRFVQWYYRYGPAAAEFLNAHPGYKPAVRALLMPVVGASIFMTETTATMKVCALIFIGSALVFGLFLKKRRAHSGGAR